MLVLFVITLASILVVNLTFSTSLTARTSAQIQRSSKAEFLLKSALNMARVLLKEDKTQEDSIKDTWGMFSSGMAVPPELLEINEPNISLELEIRPEESKIPLAALVPPGATMPDQNWQQTLTLLFQKLGFDSDEEEDQTGYFPGRRFSSEELVAVLIDYMDPDKSSFQPGGIEAELPDDLFPNAQVKRVGELAGIPGFTAERVRKLTPFISAVSDLGGNINRVNINVASPTVLGSLHPNLDENMVQQIIAFRNGDQGPFKAQNYASEMLNILGDQTLYNQIAPRISERSRWFQVIAKASYGDTSVYFLRAYLLRNSNNELPEIQSLELF